MELERLFVADLNIADIPPLMKTLEKVPSCEYLRGKELINR